MLENEKELFVIEAERVLGLLENRLNATTGTEFHDKDFAHTWQTTVDGTTRIS